MSPRPARPASGDRSAEVADAMWKRVRALAERIGALEELEALDALDHEGSARLDALRLRCARAAERAGLADRLADALAERRAGVRGAHERGSASGAPPGE